MKYPTNLFNYQNKVAIYIPDPNTVKLTYERLVEKNASTPFPFWAKLWPSSLALTAFLQDQPKWVANKKVLEIGAGIGLPSFSISGIVSEVLISDHAKDAVELITKNINVLKLNNARAMMLDWNQFPDNISADTILLSDINYAPEQFEPLLKLLKRFLNDGSALILATPQRIMGIPFIESLLGYIKETHVHTIMEKQQPIDISILILQA